MQFKFAPIGTINRVERGKIHPGLGEHARRGGVIFMISIFRGIGAHSELINVELSRLISDNCSDLTPILLEYGCIPVRRRKRLLMSNLATWGSTTTTVSPL